MNIKNQVVVALKYTLRLDNKFGDVIEIVKDDEPMIFLNQSGSMLDSFEAKIANLEKGNHFEFSLSKEEAYGDLKDEYIVDVPMKSFEIDGKIDKNILKKGKEINMEDEEGNMMHGEILAISSDSVNVDFNHPLAGETIYFKGEIIGVRPATPEELEQNEAEEF
jgi:FKBP-type peptidyl-prolyl cis-trans isomerase SlyD